MLMNKNVSPALFDLLDYGNFSARDRQEEGIKMKMKFTQNFLSTKINNSIVYYNCCQQ